MSADERPQTPREQLEQSIAAGAPADGWTNIDVELDDEEQCPLHGENAEGSCWACHRAACLADPASCEPW